MQLLVSDGVRLDRLQNNAGRTLATVTNLNSLPVDLEMSIALFRGGDFPAYDLTGRATLGSGETGSVLLEEEQGRQVDCSGGCSYDFRTVAQVAATDQEPHTNEQLCTPEVCSLDPEPSASPSG